MKTRAKKSTTKASASKSETDGTTTVTKTLGPATVNPPTLVILPKDAAPEARVISLPGPATSSPDRYFVCPSKGFYEFTKIAAPNKACRSWLLAAEASSAGVHAKDTQEASEEGKQDEGYVLEKPDVMVATPIDPLFILLPMLADGEQGSYLTFSDYIYSTEKPGWNHLQQVLRQPSFTDLEKALERRMDAVCDTLDMGDGEDRMYQLSTKKLIPELVKKAWKMVEGGLPASMEERFVKQALEVPVLSIKREESGVSAATDDATPGADTQDRSAVDSQATNGATATDTTADTAAASVGFSSSEVKPAAPDGIPNLIRLRTALNFIITSYIPTDLRITINKALASPNSPIDFAPLESHLGHLADLKKQAHALRSISDNISRKRTAEDDEGDLEKAEAKKRKKEEDEFKKKNTSRGVQQLAKADTSGMKKLSSFFTKGLPKKKA